MELGRRHLPAAPSGAFKVLCSKTWPQGQFTCPEDVRSPGSPRNEIAWGPLRENAQHKAYFEKKYL